MNKLYRNFRQPNVYQYRLTGGELIFAEIVESYSKQGIMPSYPLLLNIDITGQCNGKCHFCVVCGSSPRAETDCADNLLYNRIKELVNRSAPVIVGITGGEPLLFPNRCYEYIKLFENSSIELSLMTNLSLKMRNEHLRIIDKLESKPLSQIQTSIDSMNYTIHKFLRRGTDLLTILNNINKIKKRNIKLKVNTTVSQYNYKDIMNVVKYVCDEGIDGIHLNHVLPYGRAKGKVDTEKCFDIIEKLFEVSLSKEFNMIPEHTITFPSEILPLLQIDTKHDEVMKLIGVQENMGQKLSSPQYVCTVYHDTRECRVGWLGNKTVSLEEMPIADAFEKLNTRLDPAELCQTCKLFPQCNADSFYTGSCMLEDLEKKIDFILSSKQRQSKLEYSRDILHTSVLKRPGISEVIICMTTKCNGKCNFCQLGEDIENIEGSFNPSQVANFLKGSQYLVQITGGEPLLQKKALNELIYRLKKDGHIISLLTNLVLIDDHTLNEIKSCFSGLDVVQVSIYGNTSELHEEICGRNDWDLLNLKIQEAVQNGIPLRANLTLVKENMDYIDEIIAHYQGLNIDSISINGLLRKGRAKDMVDERYLYKYINSMYCFLKKGPLEGVSISIPLEVIRTRSNFSKCHQEEARNKNLQSTLCDNGVYIHSDGAVYTKLTRRYLGMVTEQHLSQIPASYLVRDLSATECVHCNMYDYCKGIADYSWLYTKEGNLNISQCEM